MRECKLPLRTVLQNFINNVESLEAKRENKEEVYDQEFQELKKLTESLKTHPEYACNEGEKEYNKRKNRYKDILPYDRTRVVLQAFPGIPGSDYINANYIRGASGSRAYIASQGPLPNTVPDFWRMVVECDVQVIIMASNETEGGKHKCQCYWVENKGEEKQFGNVVVSFIKSRQVSPHFLVRTLKITFTTENDKMEERTICQFHYMLWPDHGVPDTVRPLLHMVRLVRDCQASETLPVLVHCSAGCGRTGTICAIDYVWGLLRTGKLCENLHLLGLVREMRVQRVAMVQTKEQYTLLHQAVKELFRDRLNLIDSHPYENISTDGNPLMLQLSENKESDYEEFLLCREKEAGTQSSPGNPSGSLTRKTSQPLKPRLPRPKDSLRRSASTSSLDTHKIFPLLPSESALLPLTSSLDASSCPQKKISAFIDFESEPNLHRRPQAVPQSAETKSPVKRPPRLYSKVEKEAENLAQKMETKQRQMQKLNCSNSGSFSTDSHLNSRPNLSLMTPSSTLNPPPVPPPRSRTPSPIILVRNVHADSEHHKKDPVPCVTKEIMPTEKRKSLELVRRPSIPKLRELFEKSPLSTNVITCPNGAHLCRSASSVTPRSSLFSLHSEGLVPPSLLKVKRNASFRSEESLVQGSKMSAPDKDSDHFKFQICPPPPPPPTPQSRICMEGINSSLSPLIGGKPPLSPRLGTVKDAKRKGPQMPACDPREDCATHLLQMDERPALPIKKSKSFRLARPQTTTTPTSLIRGAEFWKKKTDMTTTYFSLDRGKENSPSRTSKGENSIKKIANDFFPLPQEGLKLSVYEASLHSRPSSSSASFFSEESLGIGKDSEADRPLIPPKMTSLTEGDKSSKMCKLLQMPLSRSDEQINQSSFPLTSIPPISKEAQAPPSLNTPALENDPNAETLTENLYDELPCHSCPVPKTEVTLPLTTQTESLSRSSGLQGSKDYVNTRVLTSYLGKNDSQSLSYVPLPSKRESKEKAGHDYANCCVFAISDSKIDTGKASAQDVALFSNQQSNLMFYKSKQTADDEVHDSGHLSTHSSTDYEPVDFGENLTSVDEVFETVNYELVDGKSKSKKNKDRMPSLQLDYYLNKDLDSLAIQVYKDCQAYLLNGSSRAPVPSLMPMCKLPNSPNSNLDKISRIPDLEEVRNKVSVPPQGLRNRERRNSYRQAVSMASPPHSRMEKMDKATPLKKIHKYEKIWFETMNEQRGEDGQGDDENKPEEMTAKSSTHDFSSNLNHQMNINGKEVLFKDKLEELHGLVSNVERKNLTDLSEEDLSSRDSGSSSSLFSRSAQSWSSERGDPIYANVPFTLGSYPPALTEASGKPTHTSFQGSSSPYGTLATTTSHPYKPRMAPPQHKIGQSWVSGPYKKPLGVATLPGRTASPPTRFPLAQNVPPPQGFGKPLFLNQSPCPVDTVHARAEHHRGKTSLFSPVFRSHSIKGVVSSENSLPLEPEPNPESSKQKRRHPKTEVTKIPSSLHKGKALHQEDYSRGADHSTVSHPAGSSSMPGYENECFVAELQDADSELGPNPSSLSDSASDPPNPSLNPSVYYHPPMVSKSTSQWEPNNLMAVDTKATFLPEISSTNTDDEPLTQKASTSNLLRKLKGTNSKASAKGTAALVKNDDVGDSFISREDKGAKRPCSPPGSPRPFSKAFGKLKSGSKFVATNLKSYLSSRGNLDSCGAPMRHYPLQKSISLGPTVSVLSQVVDDCTPPSHLPKKPNRELLPHNVHSHHHPSREEPKATRARQEYL